MNKTTQKDKILKAKVATALYREHGKVPTEDEITNMYHAARVLYRVVLGTHYIRKRQKKTEQLVLL